MSNHRPKARRRGPRPAAPAAGGGRGQTPLAGPAGGRSTRSREWPHCPRKPDTFNPVAQNVCADAGLSISACSVTTWARTLPTRRKSIYTPFPPWRKALGVRAISSSSTLTIARRSGPDRRYKYKLPLGAPTGHDNIKDPETVRHGPTYIREGVMGLGKYMWVQSGYRSTSTAAGFDGRPSYIRETSRPHHETYT